MKILSIDNMLEAAQDSNLPDLDAATQEIETAATNLAERLAKHLDINAGAADYERGFGGCCATFSAKTPDQPCPKVIEDGDPGGDWEE